MFYCLPGSPEYLHARNELLLEAQQQYALAHDNIVRVYGVAEGAGGLVWIVMELGVMSFSAFLTSLRPPGSLPLVTVLRLTRDVLAALVHLHGQDPRLVHYDLKAPNVVCVSFVCGKDSLHTPPRDRFACRVCGVRAAGAFAAPRWGGRGQAVRPGHNQEHQQLPTS